MIKLEPGNVLLKPSHRRQFTAWIRRLSKLAERFGNYLLTFSLKRTGRQYELRANFTPAGVAAKSCSSFECRVREHDYLDGLRNLCRQVTVQLHDQCLRRQILA